MWPRLVHQGSTVQFPSTSAVCEYSFMAPAGKVARGRTSADRGKLMEYRSPPLIKPNKLLERYSNRRIVEKKEAEPLAVSVLDVSKTGASKRLDPVFPPSRPKRREIKLLERYSHRKGLVGKKEAEPLAVSVLDINKTGASNSNNSIDPVFSPSRPKRRKKLKTVGTSLARYSHRPSKTTNAVDICKPCTVPVLSDCENLNVILCHTPLQTLPSRPSVPKLKKSRQHNTALQPSTPKNRPRNKETEPLSPDLFASSPDNDRNSVQSSTLIRLPGSVKQPVYKLLKSPVLRYSQMNKSKKPNSHRPLISPSLRRKQLLKIKFKPKKTVPTKNDERNLEQHRKWTAKFDGNGDWKKIDPFLCNKSFLNKLDRSIDRRSKPWNLKAEEINYLLRRNIDKLRAIQTGEIDSDRHKRFHGGLKLKSTLNLIPHPAPFFHDEQSALVGQIVRELFKDNDDPKSELCVDYNEQILKPEAMLMLLGRVMKYSREETLAHVNQHWLSKQHCAPRIDSKRRCFMV